MVKAGLGLGESWAWERDPVVFQGDAPLCAVQYWASLGWSAQIVCIFK